MKDLEEDTDYSLAIEGIPMAKLGKSGKTMWRMRGMLVGLLESVLIKKRWVD